jgi:predicted N-acetyltransferase YhbS
MEGAGHVLIRPAGAEDASAIAEVIRRAFAAYEGRLQPPAGALKETPESIAEKLRHEASLLAVRAAGIVGCVFYRPAKVAGEIYLGRLAVLPECQRDGIAARLMAALEEAARGAGAGALVLNVRIALPANRALIERLGFQAVGQGQHPGFDQPTFTVMRKELSGAAPNAMRSR